MKNEEQGYADDEEQDGLVSGERPRSDLRRHNRHQLVHELRQRKRSGTTPSAGQVGPGSKLAGPDTAFVYVRVSTREQARTGGGEEGYSIPAQRAACLDKAKSLGAVVAY